MVFSELYSAYYNTVAAVLKAACDHPLRKGELRRIVDQKAFGESVSLRSKSDGSKASRSTGVLSCSAIGIFMN